MALMVIVISLVAIIDSISTSTWRAAYLKEKTIAGWVAQNQIALYRAKKLWTDASSSSGDASMANLSWQWRMNVSATEDPLVRKIEVEVYLDGDDEVKATATGFIGKL